MPPKPWETRKKPMIDNISEVIQSNPTPKEQTPKISTDPMNNINNNMPSSEQGLNGQNTSTTGLMGTNNTNTGYGSSYGGYGSSYGGYGSSYGGGYGGYGSSYGGYGMGMGGGMYGMGRMGMMGNNQNQQGFLFHTMMALESFTYMINCLCQIARSMDQNYEGLSLFYKSFKNLIGRMQNSVLDGFKWVINKIKSFFLAIFNFFIENIFFMRNEKLKSKYKSLKFILIISIVVLGISMYPLIKSLLKATA